MGTLIKSISPELNTVASVAEQIAQNRVQALAMMNSVIKANGINLRTVDGKTDAEAFAEMDDKTRKNIVNIAKLINKENINLDNVVFDATINENGFYIPKSNTIVLNPNATFEGNQKVFAQYKEANNLKVFSSLAHEDLHAIRQNSEADYQEILKAVKKAYIEQGNTEGGWKNLVLEKRRQYKKAGQKLRLDQAEDEVVAEIIQNPGIAGNADFIAKAEKYSNDHLFKLFTDISNMVQTDNIQKIRKAMLKGYSNMIKNGYKGYIGDNYVSKDKCRMSLETWFKENGQEYVDDKGKKHIVRQKAGRDLMIENLKLMDIGDNTEERDEYGLNQAQRDMLDKMDAMANMMQEFMENPDKMPHFENWQATDVRINEKGEIAWTCVVPNGDYELNIDFSTICKKRKTMDKVLNILTKEGFFESEFNKKDGQHITQEQMGLLRNIIKNNDFEVSCGLCFVDTKRFNVTKWAGTFTETYNEIIDILYNETENTYVDEFRYQKNAVNNVSFTARKGEITCIAGIDGNGQTELVYALSGLENTPAGATDIAAIIGKDETIKRTRNSATASTRMCSR